MMNSTLILKSLEAEQERRKRAKVSSAQAAMADEMLRLMQLPHAEALAQSAKLRAMAQRIKGDERALEEFRWRFILQLDKQGKVVTQARQICEGACPFLVPYLGILYPQLQQLVKMIKDAKREGRALSVEEVMNTIGRTSGLDLALRRQQP